MNTPPHIEKIHKKYRVIKLTPIVKALQIYFWADAFKNLSQYSFHDLENILSAPKGRKGADRIRFFQNIQRGHKPSVNHYMRTRDIIEDLHNLFGFHELRDAFLSPFWYLISPKVVFYAANDLGKFRTVISEAIEITRYNYTNSKTHTAIQPRYFEFDEPLRYGRRISARKAFRIPDYLLSAATFDQLAVLGFIYREAYISCSILYAAEVRELFIEKLHELLAGDLVPEQYKKPLFELTVARVLTPISQYRRKKTTDLLKTYTAITPVNRDKCTISFIKSHNKSILKF